jgi:hypothetical protein
MGEAMPGLFLIISLGVNVSPGNATDHNLIRTAEAVCAQVISCGIKDGKMREYPTPCAAEEDGATSIRPKQGASCS